MEKETTKIKQITARAEATLRAKRHDLEKTIAQLDKKQGDIITQENCQAELAEINSILNESEVVEFNEKTPVMVLVGTKVMIENLKTGDTREYTIMTRSTAHPLKGIISNESPLAQRILGLKLGNTYKFKDVTNDEETYKIKSID